MQKNIALMAGGNSSEYDISVNGAEQVEKAIDTDKYNPYKIFVKGKRWFYADSDGTEYDVDKNDFSLTVKGEKIQLEYALILIHGNPGENGLLQAYFELMEIPYSSSDFLVSALTFDKAICKKVLEGTGVTMAKGIVINKGETVNNEEIVNALGLPVFVKPNASGSSFGVSKVKTMEELMPAINNAFTESGQILVEEFIEGTEVSCGVMEAGGKSYIFPITEIVSRNEFFDHEAKYTEGRSEEITPARIDKKIKKILNDETLKIYRHLGCRGIARIDFIIKNGTPCFIEINTVPGMSSGSIIPKQAAEYGMSMTELFNIIIEATWK
ncbi:MAG: D-alanine--D-alanine ligase [Rikenellaceae bacterium]|nr:D-alanine--D-alanine ligase [Rikenellaceae bacterium]